ncbi:hypothetical protein, partial [Herbaspirillum autotrophicum]|uniref:hypothetical protein n=1 Tax=Herbaspirillum autotrophicum TaxID=180195 RepID=UPI001E646773
MRIDNPHVMDDDDTTPDARYGCCNSYNISGGDGIANKLIFPAISAIGGREAGRASGMCFFQGGVAEPVFRRIDKAEAGGNFYASDAA